MMVRSMRADQIFRGFPRIITLIYTVELRLWKYFNFQIPLFSSSFFSYLFESRRNLHKVLLLARAKAMSAKAGLCNLHTFIMTRCVMGVRHIFTCSLPILVTYISHERDNG